jgi:hypothetical protein
MGNNVGVVSLPPKIKEDHHSDTEIKEGREIFPFLFYNIYS